MIFPKYYVLEQLLKIHRIENDIKDFYIISVQHLMRSTGSLFESIIEIGIKPSNIFLTGKIYSAHTETIRKLGKLGVNIKTPSIPDELGHYANFLEKDVMDLWCQLKKVLISNAKIIVLDDGGFVLKSVPDDILRDYQVFGIEQTTSGIRLQNVFKEFPVIHVAASAAKTIIEPPIVSEAVRIQVGKVIKKLSPKTIGIIGYGHIGRAIAKEFCSDYRIIVYDIDSPVKNVDNNKYRFFKNKQELFDKSNVIIGATGTDISELNWLKYSNTNKTLISVSSGDIEFNKLIRNCTSYLTEELISPLQDLKLKTDNGNVITVLRGGLVANFTGKPDSSPGRIIQMTRGLLFSAILQIILNHKELWSKKGIVKLDSKFQKEVIKYWFKDQPQRKSDYLNDIIMRFTSLNWIEDKS